MATLLENGGTVELWGGWAVRLPPAYHERNADGSWSAWGADWTIDVHIVELGGRNGGETVAPEAMLGKDHPVNLSGSGWVGSVALLREADNGRDVYRLTAQLAAVNTRMSFWVSYVEAQQRPFAEELVRNVTHAGPTPP